jgi:hypothetical protein
MKDKAFEYSGDSPAMRKLSASCKAAARAKFDVYPSAYANIWASKQQVKENVKRFSYEKNKSKRWRY